MRKRKEVRCQRYGCLVPRVNQYCDECVHIVLKELEGSDRGG